MIPSPLRRSTFPDHTVSVSTKPPAFNTSIDIARRNSTGNAIPPTSISHAAGSNDYFSRLAKSETEFQLFADSENQAAKGFNFLKDPNKFDAVVQSYSYANQRHNETLKFLDSEHGAEVPDAYSKIQDRKALVNKNNKQITLLQRKKTAVLKYNKAFYNAQAKQNEVNNFVDRLYAKKTFSDHQSEIKNAHITANRLHTVSLERLEKLNKSKAVDKQTYETDKKLFQTAIDNNNQIIRHLEASSRS